MRRAEKLLARHYSPERRVMAVRWMSVAAWLLLIPALLLTALLLISGSGAMIGRVQDRYLTEARTGVNDADRARLNDCMADYLMGQRDDLAIEATVFGQAQQAFNEREIAHMLDVRRLFDLARAVRLALAAGGIALLARPALRRSRGIWRGFLAASGVWLAGLAGLGAWLAADFTRGFLLFHELFFTNELWILDPHTDLMIRLLPESFFADMVALIAIVAAMLIAASGAAAWLWVRGRDGNGDIADGI